MSLEIPNSWIDQQRISIVMVVFHITKSTCSLVILLLLLHKVQIIGFSLMSSTRCKDTLLLCVHLSGVKILSCVSVYQAVAQLMFHNTKGQLRQRYFHLYIYVILCMLCCCLQRCYTWYTSDEIEHDLEGMYYVCYHVVSRGATRGTRVMR